MARGEDESTPVVSGRCTPALGLFAFIRLASRLAVNRDPDMNRIDGPRLGAAGDPTKNKPSTEDSNERDRTGTPPASFRERRRSDEMKARRSRSNSKPVPAMTWS